MKIATPQIRFTTMLTSAWIIGVSLWVPEGELHRWSGERETNWRVELTSIRLVAAQCEGPKRGIRGS